MTGWPTVGSQQCESYILIPNNILMPNNACASPPEVGTQCCSSARWDLCGAPGNTLVRSPHRPGPNAGVYPPMRGA